MTVTRLPVRKKRHYSRATFGKPRCAVIPLGLRPCHSSRVQPSRKAALDHFAEAHWAATDTLDDAGLHALVRLILDHVRLSGPRGAA